MPRIVFAYPPDLADDVRREMVRLCDGHVIVDVDPWSGGIEGPDPQEVEVAGEVLAEAAGPTGLIVPMSLDACAAVAYAQGIRAHEYAAPPPGLSEEGVLLCLDAVLQSQALIDLRPQSHVIRVHGGRCVLRWRSGNVIVLDPPAADLERLTTASSAFDDFALIEEIVDGPQWEVTCIVRDKLVDVLPALRRTPDGHVVEINQVDAGSVRSRCRQVIKRLGLTWCAVTVRVRGERYLVVDVRPCLGDAPVGDDYHDLLTVCGIHPALRLAHAMIADAVVG